MKLLFLTILILPTLGQSASVSFTAQYREAGNIFVIMDCVSGWWDKTFCQDDGAYQKEWSKRFGLTDEEKKLFSKYNDLRQRYYKGLGAPKDEIGPYADGIFAKKASITEDLIAPSFYGSTNLNEALEKLKKVINSEDLAFLAAFYEKFKPKYQMLLDESQPFKKKAGELNRKLARPEYVKFFSKISHYYSVSESLSYEVLFTWYPPLDKDFAVPIDKFLVLQKNPIKHIDWDDEDVVFHEIVHTISVRQPQQQKEAISKVVLDACLIDEKFPKRQKGKIMEEPMAVAVGQILFLKEFFPERLRWDSKLYNNYWISSFAKLIYPVIEDDFTRKEIFSTKTASKIGFLCNELLQTSKLLEH